MTIKNLSQYQISKAEGLALIAKLQSVLDSLAPSGKMGAHALQSEHAIANDRYDDNDVNNNKRNMLAPRLQSPDVDWQAYDASLVSSSIMATIEKICSNIKELASETKVIHNSALRYMTFIDLDYNNCKLSNQGGHYRNDVPHQ